MDDTSANKTACGSTGRETASNINGNQQCMLEQFVDDHFLTDSEHVLANESRSDESYIYVDEQLNSKEVQAPGDMNIGDRSQIPWNVETGLNSVAIPHAVSQDMAIVNVETVEDMGKQLDNFHILNSPVDPPYNYDGVSPKENIDILSESEEKYDSCESEDQIEIELYNTSGDLLLKLTDLPSEILIHISSYLDARVIVSALCQVCQLFNDLFASDKYWKTRINLRWPKKYPILERVDFNWRQGCMEREELHRRWIRPEDSMQHIMYRDGFFAAVDVVHLLKDARYLAVGSRDRHMNLLDLSKYDFEKADPYHDMLIYSDTKTHKGWVWSMASHHNTLVTGSWDTYVRLWDIGDGDIQLQSQIKCKSAILGLHYEPGFIAAAGFDKRLHMFDPRDPGAITLKLYHRQPILCIAADDKYVITGSEDKVISVYDRTAGKNYKKIDMESFVMDLSYDNGQLWSGDKAGKLHLIDARDGLFDEQKIQTIDVGHTGKLTGVQHTDGGIFTCSTDGHLKVIEPTLHPGMINTVSSHTGPISGLCYKNGVLASAGSDVAVGIWLPHQLEW